MKMRTLCTGLLLLTLAMPAVAATLACPADADAAGPIAPLPRVTAMLKPGSTLRVLGVGSATMFGPDASLAPGTLTAQAPAGGPLVAPAPQAITQQASSRAFPQQMAMALQQAVPGLKVDVVIRGGRGMTAADMVALIRSETKTGQFALVLWQTGTVEAVRNSAPGEFGQALAQGAEAIEASGANLILVDSQYSRFLQTNSNLDPYNQALTQTAAMPGVLLFHRFDLMRAWANDGQIDLERAPKSDRRQVADALHACLGQQLARMILAASRL